MGFIEVFLQTFLAFSAILIFTRILGKQQVGQLTFFEYINGITFGSIAAVLATDTDPRQTVYNLVGLALFAGFTLISGYLSMKSRPLRKVISGEPTIVIHNGKILEDNLRKMRYNIDELLMQLREKDVFGVGDVEYAILEPDGSLSVNLKSYAKTPTRDDLGIPGEYEGLSTEIVMDGEIIHQNLKQVGLDENWLYEELKKHNVENINDVALAVLSSKGDLYVDGKKDNISNPDDISDNPQPPNNS